MEASVLLLEFSAAAIKHSEAVSLLLSSENDSELLLNRVDFLPIADRVCHAVLDGMARVVEKDKGVLSAFVTLTQFHFDFAEELLKIIVLSIADVNDVVDFGTECLDSLSKVQGVLLAVGQIYEVLIALNLSSFIVVGVVNAHP